MSTKAKKAPAPQQPAPAGQPLDREHARDLLIRAKVYRFLATLLAVFGTIIFMMLYARYFNADAMLALQDPVILVFIIFPFVPAILFSLGARKYERALHKLLSPDE